ncbi:hypothetical protein WA538_002537 [Blastocystis sp. DL]
MRSLRTVGLLFLISVFSLLYHYGVIMISEKERVLKCYLNTDNSSSAGVSETQPLRVTSHVQSSARKGDKTKGKLACYTNPFSTSVHYDSNCLESWIAPVGYVAPKSNKSSVIIIPKFITDRLRRWDKVPKNESLSMGPLPLRPVRVVFVITADVSESETRVPPVLANTMVMLSLYIRNFNASAAVFTISEPIIRLAKSLGVPFYNGYQHNVHFMPLVSGIMRDIHRDFVTDYICILNSDILLGPEFFSLLDFVDLAIREGRLPKIVSFAGVVTNVHPPSFLPLLSSSDGMTLTDYETALLPLRNSTARRHYCSADYFVFSDTTPVDVFGDLVLGRDGIDNYLLTRMDACGGVLLDTTFALGALHQGMETSISKVWKRVNIGNDMSYNWELMAAMNETKGCLYRNARFVLYWNESRLAMKPYISGNV